MRYVIEQLRDSIGKLDKPTDALLEKISTDLTAINKKLAIGCELTSFEKSYIIDIVTELSKWLSSRRSGDGLVNRLMLRDKLLKLIGLMEHAFPYKPFGYYWNKVSH